jgi:hypothetical protein
LEKKEKTKRYKNIKKKINDEKRKEKRVINLSDQSNKWKILVTYQLLLD